MIELLESLSVFARLFLGTIVYRPYVYGFFVCYSYIAIRLLRFRGFLLWTVLGWTLAFVCEYSSTRNGFPFGIYRYFDATRTRELWISNVPFWDSLSFVFLSFFSWIVASFVLKAERSLIPSLLRVRTAFLAGLLMMLLDVVIDPLTLLGDRWFLGKIYDYPTGGTYFGVTLANFAGWFFVGTTITLLCQMLFRRFGRKNGQPFRELDLWELWASFGVYAGVLFFNLVITAYLREWILLFASLFVSTVTLTVCYFKIVTNLNQKTSVLP